MKSKSIQVGFVQNVPSYADAKVTKVYEDSYDIRLSNGKIYKHIPNASSTTFVTGDYVAVIFSDIERKDCRIVGRGKKITTLSSVTIVDV